MTKLIVEASVRPSTAKPPTPRQERQWEKALKKPCPTCERPAGARCVGQAPSHKKAGVAYETKKPHRARL